MSTIPSSDFRDDEKPHPWKVPSVSELYPSGVPQQLVYPNIAASQLLARSAARFPDRIAAEFFQRQFSYQEIDQAATKLAAWLQARELHSGARVGVLLPNCPEYLISLNAIWRAGAVAVATAGVEDAPRSEPGPLSGWGTREIVAARPRLEELLPTRIHRTGVLAVLLQNGLEIGRVDAGECGVGQVGHDVLPAERRFGVWLQGARRRIASC